MHLIREGWKRRERERCRIRGQGRTVQEEVYKELKTQIYAAREWPSTVITVNNEYMPLSSMDPTLTLLGQNLLPFRTALTLLRQGAQATTKTDSLRLRRPTHYPEKEGQRRRRGRIHMPQALHTRHLWALTEINQ